MKPDRSIKLIRKEERTRTEPKVEVQSDDPNSWSTEVQSWIVEFQKRRRVESLPPFNSLFK